MALFAWISMNCCDRMDAIDVAVVVVDGKC
jgi:hypothetical protein